MNAWAVVPAKCFTRGKSRLAPVLADEARASLARALCEHVLAVLNESQYVEGILVATDCDEVEAVARAHGAEVRRDQQSPSLAAVVDAALLDVAARGARAAIVLMADLPRITAEDVDGVLALLNEGQLIAVPDHEGVHTNALALSPATAVATRFGSQSSFAEHVAAGEAAGLCVVAVEREGIAFDVDGPDDLARHARPVDVSG